MENKKIILCAGLAGIVIGAVGYHLFGNKETAAAKTAAFANANGKNPFRRKAFANFIRAKRAQA